MSGAAPARVAKPAGAFVGVHGLSAGDTNGALERLVIERALSVNTAIAKVIPCLR
ncbi:hypothetical protein PS627_00872 [Pseudomonas fluorescens]|uniref:hypothetical protein n=1 Tax=Pseudomonas fluorescens TaxID=294 RepID=UPI0012522455|nr:hypothetical protein [Pseudomonas fluorescens]CAG8864122.1 hypothetical protein PS627_00872 [Pseudomonas fluorescens]VVP94045.1 hypothetical protein PS910_03152 [Pseudomonas fluorescens]